MIFAAVAAAAIGIVPVHGTVLAAAPDRTIVVRTDAVTGTLDSAIRRYHLDPPARLAEGTGIDALLDRSTQPWTLRDTVPAAPFSPGMPDRGRIEPVDVGTVLPPATLVDQTGRVVSLDRVFAGRTILLSFIFTRCPDRTLCPAISGKYAYMQSHLDPGKFGLVEITLDPPYDSPAAMQKYGTLYGADPARWALLTGTGSTIQRVLDEFHISSLRLSTSNYLHNDKLFIVSPQGRVAYIVDTADWDPEGAMSEARAVAGLAANPWERFKLSLIASVVALCGGSQFAGVVLLELTLFFFIILVVAGSLWWVARVLWGKPQRQ